MNQPEMSTLFELLSVQLQQSKHKQMKLSERPVCLVVSITCLEVLNSTVWFGVLWATNWAVWRYLGVATHPPWLRKGDEALRCIIAAMWPQFYCPVGEH